MSGRNLGNTIARRTAEYGEKFDRSALDPRFGHYFCTGERIKVRTCGEEITGTVGITTGWRPWFLLMRTKRSIGSSVTLGPKDEIVAVQKGRTYVYGAA